jgi:hypothetical protein
MILNKLVRMIHDIEKQREFVQNHQLELSKKQVLKLSQELDKKIILYYTSITTFH